MDLRLRLATAFLTGTAVLASAPYAALAALSASMPDVSFTPITYSHTSQIRSGTLTLTATDTGSAGLGLTNSGWNVTVLSSSFAYAGPNAGAPIPAGNLVITAAQEPTHVSGQAISPTGGPRTTNVTGALDVARKTIQADGPTALLAHHGIGTYSQALGVDLIVPAGARAGSYAATLTVTMAAGP